MAIIRDVTEKLASDKVLERLYAVSSNPDLSFEQSRHAILQLGCEYFGMPLGVVSRIENERYEVLDAVDAHDSVRAGQIYDARETHCFEIVSRRGPYAVDRSTHPEICDHPAYQRFGIASYIGAPLHIRGRFVGAIGFSSSRIDHRIHGPSSQAGQYVRAVVEPRDGPQRGAARIVRST